MHENSKNSFFTVGLRSGGVPAQRPSDREIGRLSWTVEFYLLRTYVLDSARLLLLECLRETKEKHDLKGHRARTQTAALRVGGS